MIIGAIDVGSNSVKLLLASTNGKSVRAIAQESEITRLGGGVDRTGSIARAAQNRTIALLKKFRRECEKAGADRILAVGTEAMRLARNGKTFAERCRKEAGIPLRILRGLEEARLAFLGATSGRHERRIAAIDIGGGSTEIMMGKPGELQGAVSLGLGAVRLTEQCLKSDPPTMLERLTMLQCVHEELERLPAMFRRTVQGHATLLGIGGTSVNVAKMVKTTGSPEGRVVKLEVLEEIIDRLAQMPLSRRKKVPGIDPDRADIIIAGARIMAETLKALNLDSFTATVHGLRRGVILHESSRQSSVGRRGDCGLLL